MSREAHVRFRERVGGEIPPRDSMPALPPGADLRPLGSRSSPLDAGRVGGQGGVPPQAGGGPAGLAPETVGEAVHGRDPGSGARSRTGQDQDRVAVGAGPGRPRLGRPGPARGGVLPCRGGEHAETFLKGFKGILQVDGYGGYNRLAGPDRQVRLAYLDARPAQGSRGLREHRLEGGGRGLAADRGVLRHRGGDPRPQALTRKNALFPGHDEGATAWGRIASLIKTAKLNGAEPYAYLKATLEAIASGHPASRIDELSGRALARAPLLGHVSSRPP